MQRYSITRDAIVIFVLQLAAHISLIALLFIGTWWQWCVVMLMYFLNGCIGMTMTYHKLLSHRSWEPPSWFMPVGVLCATIGLTGPAIAWVAIHREHHRYTDKPEDPHSPHHGGWFRAHYLSMFVPVNLRYGTDLMRIPFLRWQQKWYFAVNAAWAIICYAIDPMAVLYAWLVPAAVLWNAGSSIVTFAHMIGYKNSDGENEAHNNALLAFLVWGEGWHDNHHARPASADFGGRNWWEFDISYAVIKLLTLGRT